MRLIVAANRSPIRQTEDGWAPAIGGLATALLPVVQSMGGVWVSSKDEPDQPDRQDYQEGDTTITVRRVELSEEELQNYYSGMANSVLWPVSHYMIHHLEFERAFFRDYDVVNRRFADVIVEEYHEGDVIWVQDYHLMLVPLYIRERIPDAKIGFFWHIPWPAMEVYRILPWARTLLQGLLACDLIGFHVGEYVENFIEGARVLLGARTWEKGVVWHERKVRVEAHPIGIDVEHFKNAANAAGCEVEELRKEVGTEYLIVGVDRLDYTKGILPRLLAFEELLQKYPEYHERVTLYQIATPSRTEVESYRQLKREVDEAVGRINGAFAVSNWVPIRYRYRPYTQEELVVFYRAADVMLVTPIRDGMNLVTQEFIAASENGVLVLSELTGAAYLMPEALQVNSYDHEALTRVMVEALEMSEAEKRERLSRLKKTVEDLDVHQWAGRFLTSLEAA